MNTVRVRSKQIVSSPEELPLSQSLNAAQLHKFIKHESPTKDVLPAEFRASTRQWATRNLSTPGFGCNQFVKTLPDDSTEKPQISIQVSRKMLILQKEIKRLKDAIAASKLQV